MRNAITVVDDRDAKHSQFWIDPEGYGSIAPVPECITCDFGNCGRYPYLILMIKSQRTRDRSSTLTGCHHIPFVF